MGKHSTCVFDLCDNDMQYPELHKRQSNVDGDILMHKLPKDEAVRVPWIHVTLKSRKDLKSGKDIPKNGYVC